MLAKENDTSVPHLEEQEQLVVKSSFEWQQYRLMFALSTVGLCVNCQPSEPYLTQFLEEEKNLTSGQLNTTVWPFYTYGSFVSLLLVGLAVETMGYKPVILFGLLCRESTRLLLLFGSSLPLMSLMQMTYASASAVNAIYFAYAYCVMDPRFFQQATACMHASFHIGNIFGSVLGQVLYDHTPVKHNLDVLFYLSWGFTSLGVLCFFILLPRQRNPSPPSAFQILRDEGFQVVFAQLRRMYAHAIILLWSLWWLMGFGASNIITNYYQTQFYDIESDGDFGTVEALIEFFSAVGSVLPALLPVILLTRPKASLVILCGTSGAIAAMWYLSTLLQDSIFYSYAFNIIGLGLFNFQYSFASAGIALTVQSQDSPRYALLFTFNSFVALGAACLVQGIAAFMELDTDGFYCIASAQMASLVLLAPTIHVLWNRFSECGRIEYSTI